MQLLFESRTNLGGMSGNIRFVQRPPTIHQEPVLRPDTPADGGGVTLYGSVLRDGGKLRMWYHAVPSEREVMGDVSLIAYAESTDGIHWERPDVGLSHPDARPNNFTNLGLHSATVFIDPDSPPSHRYRATGTGKPGYNGNPGVTANGYYTAHSADGLDWTLDDSLPRWPSTDVITSIYHPGRRAGLVSLKYTPCRMGLARRSIHTAEFRDGAYADDVPALYPDDFDDISAAQHGFRTCDYYGMGMLPAGQATVGFLWRYWHQLPYSKGWGNREQALYGASDVSLVYQPCAGAGWFHLPGRPDFIARSALPWTSGWINTASNVVEVGDEQRLYYSGRTRQHGYGLDVNWQRTGPRSNAFEDSGITFASWPKYSLFGFESHPDATLAIRLGAVDKPSRVRLNYEVIRDGGYVRAALTGDGFDERPAGICDVLTGNATGAELSWGGNADIPATSRAVVTLHLNHARVYAYEVVG